MPVMVMAMATVKEMDMGMEMAMLYLHLGRCKTEIEFARGKFASIERVSNPFTHHLVIELAFILLQKASTQFMIHHDKTRHTHTSARIRDGRAYKNNEIVLAVQTI